MNIRLNVWVSLIGWLLAGSVFAAQPEWKTECVGRFQVSVPGEVEVALRSLPSFTDANFMNPYRFEDDSVAVYSKGYSVSPTMTPSDFKKFRDAFNKEQLNTKRELALSGQTAIANAIRPIELKVADAFGWGDNEYADLFFYADNHLFRFYHQNEGTEFFKVNFQKSFHSRPLFDLPKGEGICIPYGFIADDGKPARQVGVTMRLIEHPDVEIFFEDRSAADYGIKQTQQTQERTEMSMLWDQQARLSKKIDLAFPGYRSTRLAGRNGTASFVEITRKDGSPDYGYAAVVNGDHAAKTDAPQFMLYVIRTASRAKGKPVSKSELKGMAYKIAASIKRREVK